MQWTPTYLFAHTSYFLSQKAIDKHYKINKGEDIMDEKIKKLELLLDDIAISVTKQRIKLAETEENQHKLAMELLAAKMNQKIQFAPDKSNVWNTKSIDINEDK